MFQFAPRKMVEAKLPSHVTEDTCPIVYRNSDIRSLSSTSSAPSSPLVAQLGVSEPDSPLSPPFVRTMSFDQALFDLRKVSPDKIAGQLTLIDLDLYKAIRMKELTNCNWTRKEKATLAPSVVAFTKRFNHTSFWVVREILNEPSSKVRAEIVTQFIKISKKLLELNNIHSLKAVLAGLQSGPIFRLSQTWRLVAKRDKATFERLCELLSADDNWKILRAHMDEAKLPCIPHLGLYLTDLCFLSSTSSDHMEDSVRNMIAYFQNSTYDWLSPEKHVMKYLLHRRYIDELQKFYEEDNYKLSKEREPDLVQNNTKPRSVSIAATQVHQTTLRASKSYEDLLSPSHPNLEPRATTPSCPVDPTSSIVVTDTSKTEKSQKKPRTLPNTNRRTGGPPLILDIKGPKHQHPNSRVHSTPTEGSAHLLSPDSIHEGRGVFTVSPGFKRKFTRGHKKASSLGTNVLQMLGVVRHSNTSPSNSVDVSPRNSPTHSRNLLDDSPLDPSVVDRSSPSGSIGNDQHSVSSDSSEESGGEDDEGLYRQLEDVSEVEVDYLAARLIMEGPLTRRTCNKGARKVSFGRKCSKVWAQLTDSALLFFPSKPKSKKTSSIKGKLVRTKGVVLRGWVVKHKEVKSKDKYFIIINESGGQMKFKASTSLVAQTWVEKIALVISGEEERERINAEKSLITL
ncbi:ras-specific guanine nucleotide-releasing factor RalGPS1-like [Halichondria panicea]|uniref:ras-specific guanine nucleotide-releasing factor RalGPS1-like n=1 Tax=Halichondria panicea TaxID=6063 RepID=UPI00312B3C27